MSALDFETCDLKIAKDLTEWCLVWTENNMENIWPLQSIVDIKYNGQRLKVMACDTEFRVFKHVEYSWFKNLEQQWKRERRLKHKLDGGANISCKKIGMPANPYLIRRREEHSKGNRELERIVDLKINGPELSWKNFMHEDVLQKRISHKCAKGYDDIQKLQKHVEENFKSWQPHHVSLRYGIDVQGFCVCCKAEKEALRKKYFSTHFCRSKTEYGKWFWFPSQNGVGIIENNKWPEGWFKLLDDNT